MKAETKAGFLYGLVAYTLWGVVPLYFSQIKHVPAVEILSHRIVWSIFILAALTGLTAGWADLWRVLRNRNLVLTLLLSATLLAVNWLLYIYATVTGRVAEASLGYFMMPLVNAFLGAVVLGEKLRPAHYPALALIFVGVCIPFAAVGEFSWIAVATPVSFGIYGLVRKTAPVDSMTGLSVETMLLFVPSSLVLAYLALTGRGQFGLETPTSLLLAFGGVVTVAPLLTYTLSIRRLPLIAVSFIQFLSPLVQTLLAVYVLHEVVGPEKWAAIGCVCAAVAIFLADAVWKWKRSGPIAVQPVPVASVPMRVSIR